MPSSLTFNCAIVTGGAGGLGRGIAEYLLKAGKKVILVGRTESKLEKTHKEIGSAGYYVLDTGDVDSDAIAKFVAQVTEEHPDVDCLINNAGIQKPLFATKMAPEDFMRLGTSEMNINIRGPIALALHMLPHLKSKQNPCIMNVTSGLAYVPVLASCPVYCATKAFMHSFTMNLRTQLEFDDSTKHINVIEIVPPQVESDLHRDHSDPDNNKRTKSPTSMSLEAFIADVAEGWEAGDTTVAAGMAKMGVKAWFKQFGEIYEQRKKMDA
ncbi:uncharacterized protein PV09_06699 [Verruconis gallopava]|uniref:NAD(P)-binding protein n=1 Tax=Verruconis gallopava TaxID=253628 RepID=A0A0D2A5M5_9PEZI|nr:uncharacterized protein PV09_06699 [Verruconis gallopava]KIW01850.1 hypothetical protein PV09_06699 [Verruconis gallopava]